MPSLSGPSLTVNLPPSSKPFDDVFSYLESKGFKPKFNVLDNEASHAITEYLRCKDIKWQFVPPNKQRINGAEHAIQTFKNHFISGLCCTDCDFPSQLWDKLLQRAQDSLNMLRTSRIDPTKSAYEILEGPHDFNRTPWAPSGCQAILHEPATTRTSWGPCGTDAWYLCPAMHHYRSYEFYIPETQAYQISASAKFFASYCNLPTESLLEQNLLSNSHSNSHKNPHNSPTFADEDKDSIIIPLASIPENKRGPTKVQIPHFISQEALQAFASHASAPSRSNFFLPKWRQRTFIPHLEDFANPVVHPITGQTIGKYEELANDPVLWDTWTTAFGKELGALAQGDNKTGAAGTNTIFFTTQSDIENIPSDQTITYARVVVDYCPQKDDPNRVCITVGGNLIDYPGELTTRTADLVTSKILWNSVISTPNARYVTADLKLFYLTAPLDHYEYMHMPNKIIPDHIIDQYQLHDKIKNGYVYMEIFASCMASHKPASWPTNC
eukprot:CCRYP_009657-RA/>CCRYP_009657-RA protein AED:0.25 eAED:0.25 QI:0/0/0/1/1/1/2/0/496